MAGSYGQKQGNSDVRNRVNREAVYHILVIDRKNKAKEFLMGKKKHSSNLLEIPWILLKDPWVSHWH